MLTDNINRAAYFWSMLCFVFVSSIALYFVCRYLRRIIIRELSYDGVKNLVACRKAYNPEVITEDAKIERLNELSANEISAILYLYVGLESCCDLFLDFTALRWLSSQFDSHEFTVHCLRVLVYFPSETTRLEQIMGKIKRTRDLSIADSFFLYQFSGIKLIRQTTSISSVGWNRMYEINAGTRELKTVIRQLWSESDIQISQLHWIAKRQIRLEAQWSELLTEYPNSAPAHADYAKFLMEACSNFQKTARVNAKVDRLNDSGGMTVDSCFVAFVRLFPQYLKSRILNTRGNFLYKLTSGDHSSYNGSQSSSQGDYFSPELHLTSAIVRHPRLRLALEQTLQTLCPNSFRILRDTMLFMTIGTLILFTLVFGNFFKIFDASTFQASYS
jgi:hypothetical protein